jgi:hypothetical protein
VSGVIVVVGFIRAPDEFNAAGLIVPESPSPFVVEYIGLTADGAKHTSSRPRCGSVISSAFGLGAFWPSSAKVGCGQLQLCTFEWESLEEWN